VTVDSLRPLLPVVSSYVLSFVFLGIYWNNHHLMLHMVDRVNGKILWANLHLLFWLSLVPFGTAYLGQNGALPLPTALYGVILLCAGIAYTILQTTIIASQGPGSKLKAAVAGDVKGKMSVACYAAAIPIAFIGPWVSIALYVIVTGIWLVPDRRIESRIES
jgi:uncharacterized membrane protein